MTRTHRINSLLLLSLLAWPAGVHARPLTTREAATIGRLTFEASTALSLRRDAFGSPKTTYETVVFPVSARLGLTRWMDFGFTLRYVDQTLKTGQTEFNGSTPGQFSPELKIAPWENVSVLAIWHTATSPREKENLPISRGHDFEGLALVTVPTAWPIHLNLGYLKRDDYTSDLGVDFGDDALVEPGNIFEARAAIKIPMPLSFGLIAETAYYSVDQQKINRIAVPGSSGEAMDLMVAVEWVRAGWDLTGGVGFGMLEEEHTSFDLDRGAGDVFYSFSASYRLSPQRTNR